MRDGRLNDDFVADAQAQTLYIENELAMGFRIIPDASEIRRYPNTIDPRFFESCIEGNRIVVSARFRGLHLTQLVGKRAFDHCRKHGVRYAMFCGNNEKMNRRFAKFPRGAWVLEGAVQYPEGPASALIFDTHHPIVRAFYADPVFHMFFGRSISTRILKSLNPIAVAQRSDAIGADAPADSTAVDYGSSSFSSIVMNFAMRRARVVSRLASRI